MAIDKKFLKLSRNLRSQQTPWEKKVWARLKACRFGGLKFKRQVVIGKFIVDFSCFEKKLVIELDGRQHNEPVKNELDRERDIFLKSRGYKILRFWNNEVEENLEGVLEKIRLSVR